MPVQIISNKEDQQGNGQTDNLYSLLSRILEQIGVDANDVSAPIIRQGGLPGMSFLR